MTDEQFKQSREILIKACFEILDSKGPDYSTRDRLSNFKEDASELSISPYQSLLVLMNKHMKAIRKFAQGGELTGEPIGMKVKDIINYMILFNGLIEEASSSDPLRSAISPSSSPHGLTGEGQ